MDPGKFIHSVVRQFHQFSQRKGIFALHMQMNTYDLNRLFLVIQKVKALDCYVEFTDHGGHLRIAVYFKQPKVA